MASFKHPYVHVRGLQRLPTALLSHTFSFLPPNERTLTARFICRDTAVAVSAAEHQSASLSQPLPPHAAPWAVEAGQQHVRRLPFQHKLQLLRTAAASGSEVNLEVALALLQPSIFPEMLITGHDVWSDRDILPDPGPGEAAIEAGHPHLLRWLVRHCPALVHPKRVAEAAAEHCDLAGLQGVWRVLNGEEQPVDWGGRLRPALDHLTLNAAARSLTPDAVAKLEWVLGNAGEGGCSLHNEIVQVGVVANAVRSGDLDRLRWLQERGCRLNDPGGWVLERALQYADMSVVQWLVDEVGYDLLGPQSVYQEYWDSLVAAAAKGPDGLARVLWLQGRGVVLKDGMKIVYEDVQKAEDDVKVGQARTLQYVMRRHCGDLSAEQFAQLLLKLRWAAVACGSISLVKELQQSGIVFGHQAYYAADRTRGMEMTRWLATEAKVSTNGLTLWQLLYRICLRGTPARSRELLEAVQLLVGVGVGAQSWDMQQAMSSAAAQGNLPVVQFLAQHLEQQLGCQPDWQPVMPAAVEGGCEALLEWLAGKAGCLASAGVSYMPAAKAGDRATLTALRRLGVPWGEGFAVVRAVEAGCQEPVLRWLVEQGAPVGRRWDMDWVVGEAERRGELGAEAAAWLRGLAEAETAAAGRVWRLAHRRGARVGLPAGALRRKRGRALMAALPLVIELQKEYCAVSVGPLPPACIPVCCTWQLLATELFF